MDTFFTPSRVDILASGIAILSIPLAILSRVVAKMSRVLFGVVADDDTVVDIVKLLGQSKLAVATVYNRNLDQLFIFQRRYGTRHRPLADVVKLRKSSVRFETSPVTAQMPDVREQKYFQHPKAAEVERRWNEDTRAAVIGPADFVVHSVLKEP
jgi:hypothetical protein